MRVFALTTTAFGTERAITPRCIIAQEEQLKAAINECGHQP